MTGRPLPGGFRLERLWTVASTNDVARSRGEAGEPEGLVVTAVEQTAGRGRYGRNWTSPAGNLYLSLLLRPNVPLADTGSVSLILALAMAEAIEDATEGRLQPRVKWPNDLLLDRAKIAGILLEGDPRFLVAGIGVNLKFSPEGAPYPVGSLAAAGEEGVTPDFLLAAFLERLRPRYDRWRDSGFSGQRTEWLARAAGIGEPAVLRLGTEERRGTLADVGEDGSILLANAMGCMERFTAGELFFGDA